MKLKVQWVAALIFISAVMYGVLPLFGRSYIPTHDGEYHIVRIAQFSKMLSAGYVFPRWAPDMNAGFGIPIFNYHYPLPNYVGSAIRVITRDAVYAFQGSAGLGYLLVAAASYLWLSSLFGVVPALIGATVAAFVPYLFVDLYVRGTIGEVWVTAFLLLSLFLIEKKKFKWFALAYGLLILSHNIMAMLFTPFIVIYAWLANKRAIVWMLGGLGVSAFFWIPAIVESKFVVGLNTVNFREHFVQVYELLIPSWGTEFSGVAGFGNKISFQIGIVPILTFFGAVWAWRRSRIDKLKRLFLYFSLTLGLCIVLMLPLSRSLWELVTPLQLTQYPWRLLSFVIPIAGFLGAFWVYSLKNKWWGIVLMILAVIFSFTYARPVQYEPRNEAYYLSRANFTEGTSSMGNSFSTMWTGWKGEAGTASGMLELNIFNKSAHVVQASESSVAIRTLYFPGWKAFVDNKEAPVSYPDGAIHVTVPAGSHILRVEFTETPVRKIADIISIVSAVALIFL